MWVWQKFYPCSGAWLRTANNNNYSNANYLTADGSKNNINADQSLLVRPALHSLALYKRQKGKRFSRIRRVHWPSNRLWNELKGLLSGFTQKTERKGIPWGETDSTSTLHRSRSARFSVVSLSPSSDESGWVLFLRHWSANFSTFAPIFRKNRVRYSIIFVTWVDFFKI